MKIIYLILDAISYQDSWLKEKTKMTNLKNFSLESLNFHNHYAVTHNTIGNVAAIAYSYDPVSSNTRIIVVIGAPITELETAANSIAVQYV